MSEEQLIEHGLVISRQGNLGPLLDGPAKAQYKQRLVDLEDEITEAERNNDFVRAANLKEERDRVLAGLESALGLYGKDRKPGSDAERARVNVRKHVGRALAKIETENMVLGRHLRSAIRTGAFCSYSPDTPTDWAL
jgi:hypothetical protein